MTPFSGRQAQDVLEAMGVGLYVFRLEDPSDDRTFRLVAANPAAERLTGVPREACIGRTLDANFPHLRGLGVPQGYAEVVRSGQPWQLDRIDYGDHRIAATTYALHAFPLPNQCVGVVFEDVAERVRAQEDLRRSEARQRALLDAIPDVLYRVRSDGTLLDVRGSCDGPPGLAAAVRAELARPLAAGEVRRFESRAGDVDLEVRLARTGEDEQLAIVRDITESKRAERRKDEFVAVVGHELRTPLTSIHGALGLLAGGVLGDVPAGTADLVRVARANTDRLVRLINDMLDLDKIEAGGLSLSLAPLDAVALADAAVEEIRGAAEAAGVRVRRVATGGGAVLGDRDRLLQVLANLLSNALRFSPPQTPVVLTVDDADGRVRFLVADEGPGVPADRVAQLFRKYTQLGTDARRRGGTGLGLAISKAIVDQHGGTIGLLPTTRGATFYVELGAAPGPPPPTDVFGDLRVAYGAALPAQVDALARRVCDRTTDRAEAAALAHRLHGTAGTYGFAATSVAAGALEHLLRAGAPDDAVEAAVAALRATLE